MPIRSEDIDAGIQNVLKERLTQISMGQGTQDPLVARIRRAGSQRWRESFRRYQGYVWGGGLSLAVSVFSLPFLEAANEGLIAPLFILLNSLGWVLIVRAFILAQKDATRLVCPEVLRVLPRLASVSRAEQLYCEAVATLSEAGSLLGAAAQDEILQQLNGLLDSHRKLDVSIRRYHAASASVSLSALETEMTELRRRREGLSDAEAREMMEQSISLCRRRLEHARSLNPAREQAEAQQELILQTLASVQASLTRTSAVSSPPMATEVAEFQESVTQANRRAQAVEEAVAEVMALNA